MSDSLLEISPDARLFQIGDAMHAPDALAAEAIVPVGPAVIRRPGTYAMLDAWRGVACLWVVCHHSLGFIADKDPNVASSLGNIVALNGALGVWMFFVISGYCIANTAMVSHTKRKSGWIKSRVRRIFPPMWASAVLSAVSILFAELLVRRGVLPNSSLASLDLLHQSKLFFFANLTLTQELFHQPMLSGVYWTLCYEVGFYAIVAVMMQVGRLDRRRCPRRFLSSLHAITILTLTLLLVAPKSLPYPFDLWPHFGFGIIVFDVARHGWRRVTTVCSALLIAGVICFAVQHPARPTYIDRGGSVSLSVSLLFAALLIGLYRWDVPLASTQIARLLAGVGLFSYSLYLTHMTLISYVSKACSIIQIMPGYIHLYLLITVGVCVAFGWAFFRLFERPFLKPTSLARATQTAAVQ